MFNSNQMSIDRINNQIKELEALKNGYQQAPPPVNNIINTTQQRPHDNMIEWRILNENEQVDNLYVNNKTLFVGAKEMILKGVDGSLEKWNIVKTYPIDPKDIRINELEAKLKEMEVKLNEYGKFEEPNGTVKQPDVNDDEPS